MGIRKARQIAKEMELELQNQFQMKQSTGIDKNYLKYGRGIRNTMPQTS